MTTKINNSINSNNAMNMMAGANTAAENHTPNSINEAATMEKDTIKISGISQEQLLAILQQAGLAQNVTIKQPKVRIIDKLAYIDEAKTVAICSANHEHQFNIGELDEETQIAVKKSGLCPQCLHIIEAAAKIKSTLNYMPSTRTVIKGGHKDGERVRQMINEAINSKNFTEEILESFLDPAYSSTTLKFSSFTFFKEITGMNAEEIKAARVINGHPRYLSKPIINAFGRQFVICNNIYSTQRAAVEQEFKRLRLINNEINY